MKTIYIYLFHSNYSDEHINYMAEMLECLGQAREMYGMNRNERGDLNAVEIIADASPWAIGLLEHMSECDMLLARDSKII